MNVIRRQRKKERKKERRNISLNLTCEIYTASSFRCRQQLYIYSKAYHFPIENGQTILADSKKIVSLFFLFSFFSGLFVMASMFKTSKFPFIRRNTGRNHNYNYTCVFVPRSRGDRSSGGGLACIYTAGSSSKRQFLSSSPFSPFSLLASP